MTNSSLEMKPKIVLNMAQDHEVRNSTFPRRVFTPPKLVKHGVISVITNDKPVDSSHPG